MELPSATLSASPTISPSSFLTSQPKPQTSTSSSLLNRLLGEFRPWRGLHTVAEAGGSVWLCTEALLLYRLFSTCALVFAFVLFSAAGGMPPATLGAWAFYVATAAMGLATFSSLRYLVAPERAAATECRGASGVLADLVVPLVQAALSAEITVAALYWPVIRLDNGPPRPEALAQHVVAPLLLLADAALAFRMAFRLSYVLLAPVLGGAWLALAWIRYAEAKNWPYAALQFSTESARRTVAMHIGVILAGSVVGLLVLVSNRLNRLSAVTTRIRRRVANEEIASMSSKDAEAVSEGGLERIVVSGDVGNVRSFAAPLPVYVPAERWGPAQRSRVMSFAPQPLPLESAEA